MKSDDYLGNYYGDKFHDGYDGAIYKPSGVTPTLRARNSGGGIGCREIGYIDKGTGKHQSNIVYSKYGLAPCVTAMFGVKQPPTMFIEKVKK